jgi:hypothetical protein
MTDNFFLCVAVGAKATVRGRHSVSPLVSVWQRSGGCLSRGPRGMRVR